jgi:hypothetical protein
MASKFEFHKQSEIRKLRRYTLGKKMMRKITLKLERYAENQSLRINNTIMFSLNTMAMSMNDALKQRSKVIFADFLQESAISFFTLQRFLSYIKVVLRLQECWKKYQDTKQNRMKFLTFKWDYELEIMSEYCKESKLKKHKNLLKKLENITDEIKIAMLNLYYRKSQHLYAARFYEWRKFQLQKKGVSQNLIFSLNSKTMKECKTG